MALDEIIPFHVWRWRWRWRWQSRRTSLEIPSPNLLQQPSAPPPPTPTTTQQQHQYNSLEEKLERYEIRIVRPGVGLNTEQHPGTMVEACGLAIQHTLEGIKYRLTHDLSFSITGKDASVNSRCDMEAYPEMVYGFCRSRSIHFRVALIKRRLPNKKILNSKYDFADAYKRMAHKTSLTI